MAQANGGSYNYDEHGNQTSASYADPSRNRSINYTAADQANQISMGDEFAPRLRTRFWYGSDGSRYKREDDAHGCASAAGAGCTGAAANGASTKRTLYVGNLEIVSQGGITHTKRYVAGVMVQDITGSSSTAQFLFHDHIGSVIRVVSASGVVIEGMDYGAFGERRGYTDPTLPGAVPLTTPRGFTGHEMLDGTDIIHMNGRIYDSALGRFLQADPVIQEPNNPQNFNRYSYVLNNPLSLTDPSGYLFKGLGGFLKTALSIGVLFIPLPGINFFVAAFIKGFISGLIQSGSFKGGLTSAFTSLAFAGAGSFATHIGADPFGRVLIHGLTGGILASVQGGNFGHAFVQAGLNKLASTFTPSLGNDYADGAIAAIEGGTISELTGGKFANGATTAAMQFAFNKLANQSGDSATDALQSPKSGDIVVGFDGAGRADLPDNLAIAELGAELGAKLFDAKAVVGAPVRDATNFVVASLQGNPGARVFIFGYSAGGDAAISLARSLDSLGIPVAGLVTFDPHPARRLYGVKNFTLPRNVGFSVNIFQQNQVTTNSFGIPKFPNPFLGGSVQCFGCAANPNINLTGTSVVHTNIVDFSRKNYGEQIHSALGR